MGPNTPQSPDEHRDAFEELNAAGETFSEPADVYNLRADQHEQILDLVGDEIGDGEEELLE